MENKEFDNWYKKGIDNLDTPPPHEIWNNISGQLDLNDVWKGVDSKLTFIDNRKKIIRKISYLSLLLLLLAGAGTMFFYPGAKTDEIFSDGNSNLKAETSKRSETNMISQYNGTNTSGTSNSQDATSLNVGTNTNIISADDVVNKYPENSYWNTHTKITSQSNPENNAKSPFTEHPHKPEYENTAAQNDSLCYILPLHIPIITKRDNDTLFQPVLTANSPMRFETQNDENTSSFGGFYFGAAYSYKNTWLLNNKTFSGLAAKSLEQTNLSFGHAYGISTGYYFTSKLSAELNWYIDSQQGQSYYSYYEGQYVKQDIKLNFMVLNLSCKLSSSPRYLRKNFQTSSDLIGGINFAFLKEGNDELNDESGVSLSDYSALDYGLRFGYGYNFLLNDHILISPALISDIGLRNIYKGNSFSPGSFNRTYQASIGFHFSVKYLLGRK